MNAIAQKLANRLARDDVKERCGFVTKRGRIIECVNSAENPEEGFRIDPKVVLQNLDKVVATWHTHPKTDPNLSGEDFRCFLSWPNLDHYIIGRRDGEVIVLKFVVDDGIVIQS